MKCKYSKKRMGCIGCNRERPHARLPSCGIFGFILSVLLLSSTPYALGLSIFLRVGENKKACRRGQQTENHSQRTFLSPSCSTSRSITQIYGLDYEAMDDDEECDLMIRPMADSGIENLQRKQGKGDGKTPSSQCVELITPHPSILPEDVVRICMESLQNNDEPFANAGLEVNFNFSSDRCRSALGGNLKDFISYASNPTFGCMVRCREWKILSIGPEISGTQVRGAMKTVLISVRPSSDKLSSRRFLWTLQRERRPPRQGCWLVHECLFVDNAYEMTL